jgi:ATP-dependent helicase/nuclease subunit A
MLDETEHEYRRLLYVAMTRAADRLIVAGIRPGNRSNLRELCWYDLVAKGLANSGLQEDICETEDGAIKRYSRPEDVAAAIGVPAAPQKTTPIELPHWLRTPAPQEASAGNFLRPSDRAEQSGHRVQTGESASARMRALQQGTLVHRMLQSLPDITAARRRDAALQYLARNANGWTDGDRESLATAVLTLIDDPRFAALFAPGSRAEVSIVGRLDRPGRAPVLISGQIDRLVVTPSQVLIVDYKTNHAPPEDAADAPPDYVRQLALYRAVLAKLYPQHPIRAALLWTETTELMEISTPALDAQLQAIIRGDDRA